MKINIRKSAIKDLKKISLNDRQKIHSKILILSKFPNISNVKKLTNFEPAYRLRVGNYRILFDISETTIEIGRVLHRKDSYK
ncbi:MAG: type II toxin-antitoxin system RelE/ParE family toxin [Candidatus Electrothrix sp. AS4_5]|nr:type II toxin-antitoxin system RelE/ParE family toxin [Candidatus Electrothrix gigas]MCI5191162.1 type II toxin-antitoxin system RelE/ParE family toxin [Candidatus Electrothrix gigas]